MYHLLRYNHHNNTTIIYHWEEYSAQTSSVGHASAGPTSQRATPTQDGSIALARRLRMGRLQGQALLRANVLVFSLVVLLGGGVGPLAPLRGVEAQPNMAYGRGVGPRGGFGSDNGFMVKQPIDRAQQVPSVPCQMKTISVRRQDEVAGGLSLAKTLYHVGWYTGLEHVT